MMSSGRRGGSGKEGFQALKSVHLTRDQRAALVRAYIEATDAVTQRRIQCLLLLDDGHPFDYVAAATNSEASELMEAIRSFHEKGLE
jgi:hypothetical protein